MSNYTELLNFKLSESEKRSFEKSCREIDVTPSMTLRNFARAFTTLGERERRFLSVFGFIDFFKMASSFPFHVEKKETK